MPIFVLYLGGTIGMRDGPHGYSPAPGYLAERLAGIAARQRFAEYTLHECTPLLDSSQLHPTHWQAMAQQVAAHAETHRGFVLIHGTDTMAHTASALSFLLRGLGKPVVLTGAMVPLCETPNDGEQNLVDAFHWAAQSRLHEVCVAFNRKLLRGNRTRKLWGDGLDAFDSPNYPLLGEVRSAAPCTLHDASSRASGPNAYQLNQALCLPPGAMEKKFCSRPLNPALRVAALRLYPGHSIELIADALEQANTEAPLDGLVLETYGSGNAPEHTRLIAALEAAGQRGTVMVNCTQCISGQVTMERSGNDPHSKGMHTVPYAASSALARAGVIAGRDLTPEAALAKLYVLLSARHSDELLPVAEHFALPLCGEMRGVV